MLTGLKNRSAMNKRLDEFIKKPETKPRKFAVVYSDLNGLKRTNDKKGHEEGDESLRKAAKLFRSVFYDSEIYRAGGDEFLIIAANITKKELEQRIKKLKAAIEDNPDFSFALGTYYADSKTDIRNAISIADMQMYNDKQQFYERFPDRRRK